jgi:hypothetical protein
LANGSYTGVLWGLLIEDGLFKYSGTVKTI